MAMIIVSWLTAFAVTGAVERFAARAPVAPPSWRMLPVRLAVFTALYVFWLAVWWRPVLAGFACVTTLAVMTAISFRKRQLIGEPLVFSDFGLLRLVIRHPDLYYTGFMAKPPFLAAAALFVAAVAGWLWTEPATFGPAVDIALWVATASLLAAFWLAAARPPLAGPLRRTLPAPALERHVARWGLLATLVLYALRWRGAVREPCRSPDAERAADPLHRPDLLVVVQIESFVEPMRLGLSDRALPGFSALRARALAHGPLRVPSHGAFTMRSEYAVLTGLSPAALGFRQFDPYLTDRGTVPETIASRLGREGWATLFMHPFRPHFFGRAGVIPRLGFARLMFEDDFTETERFGPYLSDAAMIRQILTEAAATRPGPALIVAVTMENHGPWQAERFPDLADPTEQYLRHIANADRAMTELVAGLDRHPGRVLLCLYGDHPPILPGLPVSDEPTTDYALLSLGAGRTGATGHEQPLTADALGRLVGALAIEGRAGHPAHLSTEARRA